MNFIRKCLLAIALISLVTTSCKEDEDSTVSVTGVKIDKTSLTLVTGDAEKLTATVEPEKATDKTVTWASSDAAIATVGDDGTVTAVKAGNATVTVTTKDGGKKATCTVTVNARRINVTGVTLDATALTLKVGDKQALTATVAPADATDKSVSWSSSDNTKVTVSATGAIEAIAAGTATITVTTADGGRTATCTITVNALSTARKPVSATISLFAGSINNEDGFNDDLWTQNTVAGPDARFRNPRGLALDGDGNLYVADYQNHAIRKITPEGRVSVLIGNTDPGWEICAHSPFGVCVSKGWLYIAEIDGGRIRRVKLGLDHIPSWPSEIHIVAGNPELGATAAAHVNGVGTEARFAGLRSIEADADGNLFVADFSNRLVRKITLDANGIGTVSDYAGVLCENCPMGTQPDDDILSYLRDLCFNPVDKNLYVAALNRERIVKVTGQQAYSTFAGAGNEVGGLDYRDGIGEQVDFARPAVIAVDRNGYMFLGEQGNAHRLRFVTPDAQVFTIAAGAGTPDAAHNALLPAFEGVPSGIAVTPDGETLYVSEGQRIWKIVLTY